MNDDKINKAVDAFDKQQNVLSKESEINMLNTTLLARTEALNILANVLSAGLLSRKASGDKLIPVELEAMQKAIDVEQKKTEEMYARIKQLCAELTGEKVN